MIIVINTIEMGQYVLDKHSAVFINSPHFASNHFPTTLKTPYPLSLVLLPIIKFASILWYGHIQLPLSHFAAGFLFPSDQRLYKSRRPTHKLQVLMMTRFLCNNN